MSWAVRAQVSAIFAIAVVVLTGCSTPPCTEILPEPAEYREGDSSPPKAKCDSLPPAPTGESVHNWYRNLVRALPGSYSGWLTDAEIEAESDELVLIDHVFGAAQAMLEADAMTDGCAEKLLVRAAVFCRSIGRRDDYRRRPEAYRRRAKLLRKAVDLTDDRIWKLKYLNAVANATKYVDKVIASEDFARSLNEIDLQHRERDVPDKTILVGYTAALDHFVPEGELIRAQELVDRFHAAYPHLSCEQAQGPTLIQGEFCSNLAIYFQKIGDYMAAEAALRQALLCLSTELHHAEQQVDAAKNEDDKKSAGRRVNSLKRSGGISLHTYGNTVFNQGMDLFDNDADVDLSFVRQLFHRAETAYTCGASLEEGLDLVNTRGRDVSLGWLQAVRGDKRALATLRNAATTEFDTEREDKPLEEYQLKARINLLRALAAWGESAEDYGDLMEHVRNAPTHDPDVVVMLNQLAEILSLDQRYEEARDLATRAERANRETVEQLTPFMLSGNALAFAHSRSRGIDNLLAQIPSPKQAETLMQIWNEIANSRDLTFEILVRRQELLARTDRDPELRRLFRAAQMAADQRDKDPQGFESRMKRVWQYASQVDAERSRFEPLPFDLHQLLQDYLPGGWALVSYVRYRTLVPELHRQPVWHYAAFVANGEKFSVKDLGSARAIDDLVNEMRLIMKDAAAGSSTDAEARYREASGNLRGLIWDPIADLVQPSMKVLVVPDGRLQLVNLATLAEGDERYLIDEYYFAMLPSERHLKQLSLAPVQPMRSILAYANLKYNSPEPPDMLPEPRESPFAEAFVRRDTSPILDYAALVPTCIKGKQEDEAAFKREVQGTTAENLLVATHGAVHKLTGPAYDPLETVALALGGAALHTYARDFNDGLLYASEVVNLNLNHLETVLLPACDGAEGRHIRGGGVVSLGKAFLQAGADEVVMSLWTINTNHTNEWIKAFFEQRQSRSTAEATYAAALERLCDLRQAQRDGESTGTSPHYWGLFVSLGAWRRDDGDRLGYGPAGARTGDGLCAELLANNSIQRASSTDASTCSSARDR